MKKILVIISVFILVFGVFGLGFYYYQTKLKSTVEDDDTNNTSSNNNSSNSNKAETCGELSLDGGVSEGAAPFSPVIRAKLGSSSSTGQICQWTIDGALSHSSYPVKGECLFGGRNLMTKGAHTITYKNTENSCTKSVNIVVK